MTKNNHPSITGDLEKAKEEACCEAPASLFETDTYCVKVGASLDFDGPTKGRPLYQVVNKNTAVVEREEFALPFAIRTAQGLEEDLELALAGGDGAAKGASPVVLAH